MKEQDGSDMFIDFRKSQLVWKDADVKIEIGADQPTLPSASR